MPVPEKETVRRVLAQRDRGIAIQQSLKDAWSIVTEKYPDLAWWRRKTTRAGLVWEYAVQNAIAALESDPGTQVVSHYDTVSFIFDDTVLVRFKKADLELKTRNVQTLLASLFHDHSVDLFGFNGHQRVEAAYVLNRFQTAIDWLGIVARGKEGYLWHLEFGHDSAVVQQFPLTTDDKPAVDRVMRAKPPMDADTEKERE